MENASKALIISAGIFLAIVLLTIAVGLFTEYRNIAQNYDNQMSVSEISKVNKNFTKYELKLDAEGNWNITIQDIVTAARVAKNYNEKYGANIGTNIIEVFLTGKGTLLPKNETEREKYNNFCADLIQENNSKKYSISIEYYVSDTDTYKGMVKKITFKEE